MALLWLDGFDHYNESETVLASGDTYELVNAPCYPTTENPRSGNYALRTVNNDGFYGGFGLIVKQIPTRQTVGIGAAFCLNSLPSGPQFHLGLFGFLPSIFNHESENFDFNNVMICVDYTGRIVVIGESSITMEPGEVLATSVDPAIAIDNYFHVEALVTFSETTGSVKVRVNEKTVIDVSNVKTVYDLETSGAEESCSYVTIGGRYNFIPEMLIQDIDDVYIYDTLGDFNKSFIGNKRILTLFPNADTNLSDWNVSQIGSKGYQMIDEVESDGDGTYIYAQDLESFNRVSSFKLENSPELIATINGIGIFNRSKKTDAGLAQMQLALSGTEQDTQGEDRELVGAIYQYYFDIFDTDGETSLPFTRQRLKEMQLKIERTA